MNAVSTHDRHAVIRAVEQLLAQHGRMAVLRAVLVRSLRRRPAQARISPLGLSDHLLRDIGLFPGRDI